MSDPDTPEKNISPAALFYGMLGDVRAIWLCANAVAERLGPDERLEALKALSLEIEIHISRAIMQLGIPTDTPPSRLH